MMNTITNQNAKVIESFYFNGRKFIALFPSQRLAEYRRLVRSAGDSVTDVLLDKGFRVLDTEEGWLHIDEGVTS